MTHAADYLRETMLIAERLPADDIERMAQELVNLRNANGRLFLAGLGGSAANASHAAADLRNLCEIDAICLSDNVAALTARANDVGWEDIYFGALRQHVATPRDALMVLSVGGGSEDVSVPLIRAVAYAVSSGMPVLGIVGRDGGYTKAHGDCVIVVPTVEESRVTPHTEGWQMVIIHALVSHPALQVRSTKW